MDETMREKTLDAMAELVEASAALMVKTWESLTAEERANVPPEVRAKLEELLARTEEETER